MQWLALRLLFPLTARSRRVLRWSSTAFTFPTSEKMRVRTASVTRDRSCFNADPRYVLIDCRTGESVALADGELIEG